MMSRVMILMAVVLALLVAGTAGLFLYDDFKRIERRGEDNLDPVEGTLAMPLEEATESIVRIFSEKDPRLPEHFRKLQPSRPGDGIFPDDGQLNAWVERNEGLRRHAEQLRLYLAGPADVRADDIHLWAPVDVYWESEYYYDGRPTMFYTEFILHLEPDRDDPIRRTRIEVYEFRPGIWVGEKFSFGAHSILPSFHRDIRWVEPTTQDRVELLEQILEFASQ
jgi:hypothetical protein